MVHRGHGGTQYWDTPYFGSGEADALTNGAMLPVVLSINCLTGAFNLDERSFATQALVTPNGGAVGVFGDTEVSPSWQNPQIAWGLLAAVVPRVLAAAGPATKQRVGDALISEAGGARPTSIPVDGVPPEQPPPPRGRSRPD